ncbi:MULTISPECIES: HlyD family efflux transporter periplasmic adaptor subunit [unclassified Pseudoalteromonas]|uniref:HlyD family efflux transporter periplasmic adaptor subunit n=1 Tax=unclassified Pseudoalteromonas TaxID=194690 RepID=UPI0005AA66F6|nr:MULTISPECIES: HlyD family efflux transporter periplasmic adaptor subunit [unclassified Pseudoalteromonas]
MEQLFRQEVINKRKYRLSGVVSLVQPPVFKYLTLLILTIVIISIVFLTLGSYTRKETVSGILQPDAGLLKLKAPQIGVITELLVREGQKVKKGDALLRIKSEKHGVKGLELNQSIIKQYEFQINILKSQLTKQRLKHTFEIQALKNNYKDAVKRLAQLELQSDIFNERVVINKEIVDQVSKLAGTGYISDLELKKQQDSLLSLNQQVARIDSERLSIQNQREQFNNQLSQLPINQAKENNLLESQIAQLESQLLTTQQQRLSELRSPANGIVTGLIAKTGKSVNLNQNLLNILPENSKMQAVIYIPTSAFGFIEIDQKTRLRYHAFPYQKYGIYEGVISQISANVILPDETDIPGLITLPSYRVVVSLKTQDIQAYGKNIPLRSGMRLDADIVIEQRSLVRWLFDPVFSIQGQL